jgi:hypothetical protein
MIVSSFLFGEFLSDRREFSGRPAIRDVESTDTMTICVNERANQRISD